ncbi:LacI family transcriptional regulator [Rubrobacter taiwanensis]|uniref:LacI family transcriptional regulator n=1 Tax=Rubrobacter taiwanensis TaxID=185139 RepID=A0A4R1BQ71_9ACTN|nr:LacI family DNA-binding transcriptional regulator [Rubrobacter taiwanensis]TCJ19678.1 LacI family transcriptional regulator [Rubrobacter taiwanensis]
MSTIKDVAREAGVSTATVSRVMSGSGRVSERMRERVLAAADRLGYRPNAMARSLRSETTRTLGLVVSNVLNPFFTAVARAVEDAAHERGYSLILGNADEDPEKEELYLNVLLERRVDGLIVSPARAESPYLAEVVEEGVPVVFVDRHIEGIGAPVVRADGRRAVGELVEYLVGLGHRELAVISGPPEVVSGRERLEAFVGAAQQRGVPVMEERVRVGDFRRASGAVAMRELLALRERPTAVFVANNLMALGALREVRRAGLKVPEDISLASFDDVSWFELVEPPVTAISQPTGELGAAAARMLLEMVEEGRRPRSLIMDAELVVRDSCGRPGR